MKIRQSESIRFKFTELKNYLLKSINILYAISHLLSQALIENRITINVETAFKIIEAKVGNSIILSGILANFTTSGGLGDRLQVKIVLSALFKLFIQDYFSDEKETQRREDIGRIVTVIRVTEDIHKAPLTKDEVLNLIIDNLIEQFNEYIQIHDEEKQSTNQIRATEPENVRLLLELLINPPKKRKR